MKLHRFIGDFNLSGSDLKILDEEILNQWRNVLKLKIGERLILGDGKGREALVELVSLNKDFGEVKILEISENKNEPKREVVLYCAILKRENFEWVVQKATEIGIKKIVPLVTKRTVKVGLKKDRLEKIIKEAAEQSGRGIVLELGEEMSFVEMISSMIDGENLFFDGSGEKIEGSCFAKSNGNINVFIGPEGGWEESEILLAKEKGFQIVSLGKLTFRAETAAVIASFLASN